LDIGDVAKIKLRKLFRASAINTNVYVVVDLSSDDLFIRLFFLCHLNSLFSVIEFSTNFIQAKKKVLEENI
jgi:hypothetical protein